jgi:hypothetical protein
VDFDIALLITPDENSDFLSTVSYFYLSYTI